MLILNLQVYWFLFHTMTGCCAINCTTQAKKGARLFIIPTNKERRAQWIHNIRRKNWIPSDRSFLCAVMYILFKATV